MADKLTEKYKWALSPFGLKKYNELILKGIDEDLAFELLNIMFQDDEIYDFGEEDEQRD